MGSLAYVIALVQLPAAPRLWDISTTALGDGTMPASTPELVEAINRSPEPWQAHTPPLTLTRQQLRDMCGSPLPGSILRHPAFRQVSEEYIAAQLAAGVPASFDARTHWPSCSPVIGHVRNQGAGCGDCWAYGATQALQDRYCIVTHKNDSVANLLSTEDTLACMDQFIGTPGQGCAGGDPQNAMVYAWRNGIVSGGDYGEKDHKTCLPFAVPPSGSQILTTRTVPTPKCPKPVPPSKMPPCDPIFARNNNKTWLTDKHKSGQPYFCNDKKSVACLQACLMSGPVETSMTVFGDIWSCASTFRILPRCVVTHSLLLA